MSTRTTFGGSHQKALFATVQGMALGHNEQQQPVLTIDVHVKGVEVDLKFALRLEDAKTMYELLNKCADYWPQIREKGGDNRDEPVASPN